MDGFLHSIPWTLALAMAQAGNEPLPPPFGEAASLLLESMTSAEAGTIPVLPPEPEQSGEA